MNKTTIATMIQMLRERRVGPDETFTAASGADYGYVNAYRLPKGDYLVQYGDNGESNYDLTEDVDDLAVWLLPGGDDLCDGSEDAAIIIANVRGIGAVTAATEEDEGPFRVVITRSYYGPTDTSDWARDDERNQEPLEFDNYEAAQDWIDTEEDGPYTTSNNEARRPTYTIILE